MSLSRIQRIAHAVFVEMAPDTLPTIIDVPIRTLAFVSLPIPVVLAFMSVKGLLGKDIPLVSVFRTGDDHPVVQQRKLLTRIERQDQPSSWDIKDIQTLVELDASTLNGVTATSLMMGYWYHVDRGEMPDAERYLARLLASIDALPTHVRRYSLESQPNSTFDEAAFVAAYIHQDLVGAVSLLNRARTESGTYRSTRLRAEAAVQWLDGDTSGALERLHHALECALDMPFPDVWIHGEQALIRKMIADLEQQSIVNSSFS
jgi:hypothetical protein